MTTRQCVTAFAQPATALVDVGAHQDVRTCSAKPNSRAPTRGPVYSLQSTTGLLDGHDNRAV